MDALECIRSRRSIRKFKENPVDHETIENIIETKYRTNKYNTVISKTKKILLNKYNKCITSVAGEGYKIVEPDDFVDVSLKEYKRGFKAMQKGANTLHKAPVKDMTDEGRTIYRRVHDRATLLEASMRGVSVELKTLGQKRHPFAIENVSKGV